MRYDSVHSREGRLTCAASFDPPHAHRVPVAIFPIKHPTTTAWEWPAKRRFRAYILPRSSNTITMINTTPSNPLGI